MVAAAASSSGAVYRQRRGRMAIAGSEEAPGPADPAPEAALPEAAAAAPGDGATNGARIRIRRQRRQRRPPPPPPTMVTTMPPSPSIIAFALSLLCCIVVVQGYHHAPCKKVSVRRQFQFSECYAPNLNPDLYLNRASFIMAHDAATGYLNINGGNGNGNGDDGTADGNSGSGGEYSSEYASEYDGVDDMNGGGGQGGDVNDSYDQGGYNSAAHPSRWNTVTTRLLSLYGKTQLGSVYQQLNDGARALDLRPKIYNNGTIGFHHGSLIDVPLTSVTMGTLLEDAKQWCNDNPKELVIIFHSELVHEAGYNGLSTRVYLEVYGDDYAEAGGGDDDDANNANNGDDVIYDDYAAGDDAGDDYVADDANQGGDDGGQQQYQYEYYYSGIAKMKDVYSEHGVPYYPCDRLAGLTVGEAMELADLSKTGGKGYLLAVDRHDMYASFCGKANWAQDQLVTCHSRSYGQQQGAGNDYRDNGNNNNDGGGGGGQQQSYIHCTDSKGTGVSKLSALQSYVTASTNNEASDNSDELGPPADESYYPFNQIQGFWQVDATSVQIGIMHASNLLDDNRRSGVNEEMVKMAYGGGFDAISIFALDNVALNGNAMFSVLRNACGQTVVKDDDDEDLLACGRDLIMPNMKVSHRLPLVWNIVLFVVYGALVAMVAIMLFQAFRLRNEGPQDHRLICHGHVV